MWNWKPKEYKKVFTEFYENRCDEDTRLTIDTRLDRLLEKGNLARKPVSEHLNSGIYELRAKNARCLFYFGDNKTIVFVHAIIKKQDKVPLEDIALAKRRKKEIEDGGEVKNELTYLN